MGSPGRTAAGVGTRGNGLERGKREAERPEQPLLFVGLHDDPGRVPDDAARDPPVVEPADAVAEPAPLDRPDRVEMGREDERGAEPAVVAVRGGHLVRPIGVGMDDLGAVSRERFVQVAEERIVELAGERPDRKTVDRAPRRAFLARDVRGEPFHRWELAIEVARVDVDHVSARVEAGTDLRHVLLDAARSGRVPGRELSDLHSDRVAPPLLDGPGEGRGHVGAVTRGCASRRGAGRTSCRPPWRGRPTRS